MPADLAALAPKLDPLIRRLATDHDGERLATVAALERTRATAKADFHDLAAVVVAGAKPPAPRDTSPRHHWRARPMPDAFTAVDTLLDRTCLTTWEFNFLYSIGGQLCRGQRLSAKQPQLLGAALGQVWEARRMSAPIQLLDVRRVQNAGNLKAFTTVRAGCFRFYGWRVIQQPGQRAWVSVPQEQGRDGRWHNMIEVDNPAVLEQIRAAVLEAWPETGQ